MVTASDGDDSALDAADDVDDCVVVGQMVARRWRLYRKVTASDGDDQACCFSGRGEDGVR
jgi:hypothetical protein